MVLLSVNGHSHSTHADPATPLLWVLRDHLGLTGTKYGCGIGVCGACTVLADGKPIRSCQTPLSGVGGRSLQTVEGLPRDSPVVRAWDELDVAQCGYCQSGQLLAASALLSRRPAPSDQEIDGAMRSQLCRCGTYSRIRKAIHRAAELGRSR